jgi:hypothetical protein
MSDSDYDGSSDAMSEDQDMSDDDYGFEAGTEPFTSSRKVSPGAAGHVISVFSPEGPDEAVPCCMEPPPSLSAP